MTGSLRIVCVLVVSLLTAAASRPAAAAEPHSSQPTHTEGKSLCVSAQTRVGQLSCLCLDANENILACDLKASVIKVISPDDKLLATWKPGFAPRAIHVADDGTAYVGGTGRIAKLNGKGAVLKSVGAADGGFPNTQVTSISAGAKDVFVAMRGHSGYVVYRFDRNLARAKQIVARLRGCCGQMDIKFHDGRLYVAENSRKRIVIYDRDGRELGKWQRSKRTDAPAFGSCCNPMNICFGPGGLLYTSESSVGRVMCFKPDGTYVRTVCKISTAKGCLRVTVAATRDGRRIYVLDNPKNVIHVLEATAPKANSPTTQPARSAPGKRSRAESARLPTETHRAS